MRLPAQRNQCARCPRLNSRRALQQRLDDGRNRRRVAQPLQRLDGGLLQSFRRIAQRFDQRFHHAAIHGFAQCRRRLRADGPFEVPQRLEQQLHGGRIGRSPELSHRLQPPLS